MGNVAIFQPVGRRSRIRSLKRKKETERRTPDFSDKLIKILRHLLELCG